MAGFRAVLAAGILTAVGTVSASAQPISPDLRSQAGDNRYLDYALDEAERALQRYGVTRTGWATQSALHSGGDTTYSVRSDGRGYIVLAGDQDTAEVCLYPHTYGMIDAINATCGQGGAVLTLPNAGRYDFRVEMTRCNAPFCYFVLVTGY